MSLLPRRRDDMDDFQSPPCVLDPLLPFLKPASIVWECATGKGNLVRRLTEAGHWVIHIDILTGTNFFTDDAPFIYDLVVTNPPFTLKNQFLERCYEMKKPLALLMPFMPSTPASDSVRISNMVSKFSCCPRRSHFTIQQGKQHALCAPGSAGGYCHNN